jgi:hypothetical protein
MPVALRLDWKPNSSCNDYARNEVARRLRAGAQEELTFEDAAICYGRDGFSSIKNQPRGWQAIQRVAGMCRTAARYLACLPLKGLPVSSFHLLFCSVVRKSRSCSPVWSQISCICLVTF